MHAATATAAARPADFREAHAQTGQHGANLVETAIDVTADEELLGAAPLQFDARQAGGSSRGLHVGRSGLGRAAGVRERARESFPPPVNRGGCRIQRERVLVERRGPVERERGACLSAASPAWIAAFFLSPAP